MKKIPALLIAVAILSSCNEPMDKLTDRVFTLARSQYALMDARVSDNKMPRTLDADGKPIDSDIFWWCSGFFPGSLWYIYEYTGEERFKDMAIRNTDKLENILSRPVNHDIGFQTWCSCGHAWHATGDKKYLSRIENSAAALAQRFSPVTGTIRSWDFSPKGGPEWQWPVIIDNMMNLELLMESASLFECDSLREIAMSHADQTLANHFRPDYTSYHVVDYDILDGHVRTKMTHQGYSNDSAWARGQAWGLYGFTMMYRETLEPAYLKQAVNIAKMLMERLPKDGIPFWDFDSNEVPYTYKDASAAAIMASAFIELSGLLNETPDAPQGLSRRCLAMAQKQLRTLATPKYLAEEGTNGGFLLKHSVGSLPGNSEVDVPLTYADYYFMEALLRLKDR